MYLINYLNILSFLLNSLNIVDSLMFLNTIYIEKLLIIFVYSI